LRVGYGLEDLVLKNKLSEAKRYVNEILKRNPHHLEALILLANIAEKEGDKEALRNAYKQIVSHDPKNKIILFNLGVLETEQGESEKKASITLRDWLQLTQKTRRPGRHSLISINDKKE